MTDTQYIHSCLTLTSIHCWEQQQWEFFELSGYVIIGAQYQTFLLLNMLMNVNDIQSIPQLVFGFCSLFFLGLSSSFSCLLSCCQIWRMYNLIVGSSLNSFEVHLTLKMEELSVLKKTCLLHVVYEIVHVKRLWFDCMLCICLRSCWHPCPGLNQWQWSEIQILGGLMPEVMPNPLACSVSLQCSENSVKLWRTWICIFCLATVNYFIWSLILQQLRTLL